MNNGNYQVVFTGCLGLHGKASINIYCCYLWNWISCSIGSMVQGGGIEVTQYKA